MIFRRYRHSAPCNLPGLRAPASGDPVLGQNELETRLVTATEASQARILSQALASTKNLRECPVYFRYNSFLAKSHLVMILPPLACAFFCFAPFRFSLWFASSSYPMFSCFCILLHSLFSLLCRSSLPSVSSNLFSILVSLPHTFSPFLIVYLHLSPLLPSDPLSPLLLTPLISFQPFNLSLPSPPFAILRILINSLVFHFFTIRVHARES